MKDLFAKYGVPTAWYGRFTDAVKAKNFISEKGAPSPSRPVASRPARAWWWRGPSPRPTPPSTA